MFILFTFIGLAVALAHFPIVGRSYIGPASAMILGIAGGWNGALLADAVTGGHWELLGAYAVAGCIAGAVRRISFPVSPNMDAVTTSY